MRPGVRLGIDVGSVRIGVACSDPGGILATPVETVARGEGDIARLIDLANSHKAVEIVVGLPTSLSGRQGRAAVQARAFAGELAKRITWVDVRLYDERFTTTSAEMELRNRGIKGRARRAVVDQVAAVIMLQSALDAERASGRACGEAVEADS